MSNKKVGVYLLYSLKDKRSYLGSSNDIDKRLEEHNLGNVSATSHRRPLRLIYTEECLNLKEARRREKYYKSAAGRRKLKKIINWDNIHKSKYLN